MRPTPRNGHTLASPRWSGACWTGIGIPFGCHSMPQPTPSRSQRRSYCPTEGSEKSSPSVSRTHSQRPRTPFAGSSRTDRGVMLATLGPQVRTKRWRFGLGQVTVSHPGGDESSSPETTR
jgi:hypothetical protein